MMKMTGNCRMQSLISLIALSIGLCFASPVFAQAQRPYILDLNSNRLIALGDNFVAGINGINDAGQVVGGYTLANGHTHAFITGPNGVGMTDLGTLNGSDGSYATGINTAGRVVGVSTTNVGEYGFYSRSFITGPNGVGMTDLSSLVELPAGASDMISVGINDSGQIAGTFVTAANRIHAFITGPNGVGMTDLGTLGGEQSFASGINNVGQVVGWSTTADPNDNRPFITGPNGVGMTDLNSLVELPAGVSITTFPTIGINNEGQVLIVAHVPEPETYALMLAGLGLIGFLAWRQKSGNRI